MGRRIVGALSLTARQAEIVELVVHGMSDRHIAARLHLSVRTVSNQLSNLYGVTGCGNRTQLAMLAVTPCAAASSSPTGGGNCAAAEAEPPVHTSRPAPTAGPPEIGRAHV